MDAANNKRFPDPDEVISLGERLKQARALVEQLEQQWAALFSPGKQEAIPFETETKTSDSSARVSLAERVKTFLDNRPDESFSADDVATGLLAKASSIATVLSRLVREGRAEKRGFSSYGSTIFSHATAAEEVESKAEEATEVAS